ncbi:hypothetical protein HDE_04026 [Halotydeus destructor]|nr:hypothetical protein HDE_04026 [Halotydeus destructor]
MSVARGMSCIVFRSLTTGRPVTAPSSMTDHRKHRDIVNNPPMTEHEIKRQGLNGRDPGNPTTHTPLSQSGVHNPSFPPVGQDGGRSQSHTDGWLSKFYRVTGLYQAGIIKGNFLTELDQLLPVGPPNLIKENHLSMTGLYLTLLSALLPLISCYIIFDQEDDHNGHTFGQCELAGNCQSEHILRRYVRSVEEYDTEVSPSHRDSQPKVLISGHLPFDGRASPPFIYVKPVSPKSMVQEIKKAPLNENQMLVYQIIRESAPSLETSVIPVHFVHRTSRKVTTIPYLVTKSISKVPLLPGIYDKLSGFSNDIM